MNSPRHMLWVVCSVAFALRLGAFLLLDRLNHPDVWESETLAVNLLEGKGYVLPFLETVYRSYMEPLYPVLCAAVYGLTGHSTLALGLVHALLGTALVWLLFECALRIVSRRAALLAACLAGLHPGLILYSTKFHPLAVDSLCFLSVLLGCLCFSSERLWRSIGILGVLIGLCVLTRPTILACAPIIAWWIWIRSPLPWRRRVLGLAVLALCAAAVASPWVIRNHQVHNRFILTRSGTPMVFWIGNNPYHFSGSALTQDGEAMLISVAPKEVQEHILTLDELGQQDFFFSQAAGFVQAHPWQFLKRWALKWGYFWWFSPQAGFLYPAHWIGIYKGFTLVLIVLVLLGSWRFWRISEPEPTAPPGRVLLIGICLSVALVQSLFYIEGRHRLLIEPMLLILASHGFFRINSKLSARHAGTRSITSTAAP